MKIFLKNNVKFLNFDLLYCTNVHHGESWKKTFYILRFYSRKMRNFFCNYDCFGIGLRLSNYSLIGLGYFLFCYDFLIIS